MSLDSLSSSKPYIQVPLDLLSPILILPSYEFVHPAVEEAVDSVEQAMTWTSAPLLIGISISQSVV